MWRSGRSIKSKNDVLPDKIWQKNRSSRNLYKVKGRKTKNKGMNFYNKIFLHRKYVKELEKFPIEYLFEPWKAPLHIQEEADCIIGKDYPEPCVDHEESYRENIEKLKQYFNSEKRELFELILNDKNVLKPANSDEYKSYTFSSFLESEFEDF
jgi:hypothetical protein